MNVPKEFELEALKKENKKLKEKLEKKEKTSLYSSFISSILVLLAFNFPKIINMYENALEMSFPNMIIEFVKYPLGCFVVTAFVYAIVDTVCKK